MRADEFDGEKIQVVIKPDSLGGFMIERRDGKGFFGNDDGTIGWGLCVDCFTQKRWAVHLCAIHGLDLRENFEDQVTDEELRKAQSEYFEAETELVRSRKKAKELKEIYEELKAKLQ